ncbi:MAG: hypothetical protein RR012_03100 [Oscillospiraceae bacterium]
MKCFKKIVPSIIVGCMLCSIFSFSASAASAMVQKTGNASLYTSHRGPTVSYGGTIEVT